MFSISAVLNQIGSFQNGVKNEQLYLNADYYFSSKKVSV